MMDDLFADLLPEKPNILPYDGEAIDYGVVMDEAMADDYYQHLLIQTPWQHDEARLYGKHYITKRKVAWYGEKTLLILIQEQPNMLLLGRRHYGN